MTARRRIGIAIAAVFGLLLVAAIVQRNAPPTPEQAEALRLLDVRTPGVDGRDGSNAVWLLQYDVPVKDRDRVGAMTRLYLDDKDALVRAGRVEEAKAKVDPRTAFPKHAALEDDETQLLCELKAIDCLATVRRDPDALDEMLVRHEAQLAAAREIATFDGLRYGVVPSMTQEIPAYQAGHKLAFAAMALRFVRGDHAGALVDTCNDLAGWRRIGGDNDSLIAAMVADAHALGDLRLLAQMVAELPDGTSLPAECDAALAPTRPAELDLCPAMRVEFAMVRSAMESGIVSETDEPLNPVGRAVFDEDHFLALVAPAYAKFCTDAWRNEVIADRVVAGHTPAPRCGALEKVAQPVSCIMANVVGGDQFDGWQDRRTDQAAALALMRTLLWLRAQTPDQAAWPALLAKRPAELGLRRDPAITREENVISIFLHDERQQMFFVLPLRPGAAATLDANTKRP